MSNAITLYHHTPPRTVSSHSITNPIIKLCHHTPSSYFITRTLTSHCIITLHHHTVPRTLSTQSTTNSIITLSRHTHAFLRCALHGALAHRLLRHRGRRLYCGNRVRRCARHWWDFSKVSFCFKGTPFGACGSELACENVYRVRAAFVCWVAVCNTLQRSETNWGTLKNTAAHCSTLKHTVAHHNTSQHTATRCSTLQHTSTQHTAAHCSTLQHTATLYSTLRSVRQVASGKNDSCHTQGWVMSHTWMSHVTHMDESCHTHTSRAPRCDQ